MFFKIMKLCIFVLNYYILFNFCFCFENMMYCFIGYLYFGKCIVCKFNIFYF